MNRKPDFLLILNDDIDGYRGELSRSAVTIAEALKAGGYATYMAGKWHVTRQLEPNGPKHSWPNQRGFDDFYGIITGAASYYQLRTLTRNNAPVEPAGEDYFLTDAISDEAARQIREHAAGKKGAPFFQYVTYTAPHWPLHAHEEDIARYQGRFDAGWDQLREELEGGIATPFILHWPAGIRARGGLRHQPAQLPDVMATFLDLVGIGYPDTYEGRPIKPLEGFSMAPTFSNGPHARETLCWEHEGNRAVRKGKWKLVAKRDEPWELYDMEADRGELRDLAAAHPGRVEELTALYFEWAKRCNVMEVDDLRALRRPAFRAQRDAQRADVHQRNGMMATPTVWNANCSVMT